MVARSSGVKYGRFRVGGLTDAARPACNKGFQGLREGEDGADRRRSQRGFTIPAGAARLGDLTCQVTTHKGARRIVFGAPHAETNFGCPL
jgi:hypothetical protein